MIGIVRANSTSDPPRVPERKTLIRPLANRSKATNTGDIARRILGNSIVVPPASAEQLKRNFELRGPNYFELSGEILHQIQPIESAFVTWEGNPLVTAVRSRHPPRICLARRPTTAESDWLIGVVENCFFVKGTPSAVP
jgi:hypothetical protein